MFIFSVKFISLTQDLNPQCHDQKLNAAGISLSHWYLKQHDHSYSAHYIIQRWADFCLASDIFMKH